MGETWLRARSEAQIEERITDILDATARLFNERRVEDITLVMIAREANFTRSNLYRYFKTREEVFLNLLSRDLDEWADRVVTRLSRTDPNERSDNAALANLWVETLYENPRAMRLYSIVNTLLEPHVSVEALKRYKAKLNDATTRMGAALSAVDPAFTATVTGDFFVIQAALVTGFYPMTDLTELQCTAMDSLGMETDPERYRELFARAIRYLLTGLRP